MNKNPTISVLMSTYNTPDEWLSESIESILNQTYRDFEFIIIDDCSSDGSMECIKCKYTDSRIIWLRNDVNIGLTKSLNKALKIAKGKYIARMDADDISLPERFETQVKFMDENPEIIVCGSYRRAFGDENKDEIWNIPETRAEQQVQLFFFNCGITHPTAMFRKSMLDEYGITYNENYKKAQDYGIWVQCTRYAPMAVIPRVLLKYRKSNVQITSAGKKNVLEMDALIKCDQLAALNINASAEEKSMHVSFCRGNLQVDVQKLENWVKKLKYANRESKYFDRNIFESVLSKRWYDWCKKAYKNKQADADMAYKRARKIRYMICDIELFLKHKVSALTRRGRKA